MRLAKPVWGPITSPYGWRTLYDRNGQPYRNHHNGIDFGRYFIDEVKSRRVLSASTGVVADAAYSAEAGYYILVRVTSRYAVRYIHLAEDSFLVKVGQSVTYGTPLATMGASATTAVHLHFDVYDYQKTGTDKRVDPAPFITLPYPGSIEFAGLNSTPLLPESEEDTMHVFRMLNTVEAWVEGQKFAVSPGRSFEISSATLGALDITPVDTTKEEFRAVLRDFRIPESRVANYDVRDDQHRQSQLHSSKAVQDAATAILTELGKSAGGTVSADAVAKRLEPYFAAVNANIDDQPTEYVLTPK